MSENSKKMQPFVSDFGHSNTKIIAESGQVVIPSLVYEGTLVDEINGVFTPETSRKSIDNIVLNTPFGTRYVGEIAKQGTQPAWNQSGKFKYLHPDFLDTLLLAALSEVKLTNDPVYMVTAVPGEWHNDKDVRQSITYKFVGKHIVDRVKKRGGKQDVNITNVKILSETGGVFYSFILDEGGRLRIPDIKNRRIAVFDIGWRTTCIDIFEGLNRVGETRSNTDVNMGSIYENIAEAITAQTGRHLEPYEIHDVIRGDKRIPDFDVRPLYETEVARMKNNLGYIAGRAIRNKADFDSILIGGGGCEPLGEIMTNNYGKDKVEILGQFAAASGMYNYGVRVCKNTTK